MRKVVIGTRTYHWHVGKTFVVILPPQGRKTVALAHDVRGVSPETWERGCHKLTSDGQLTPQHVVDYINRKRL